MSELSLHQVLEDYLNACDVVDRTLRERGEWGPPEELKPGERDFLDAIEEIAVDRMHFLRAELAERIDQACFPTYVWEPRQGSQFFTNLTDREMLVQQQADQMGRRVVVRATELNGDLVAKPSSGVPKNPLSLSFPRRPPVGRRREIGFRRD